MAPTPSSQTPVPLSEAGGSQDYVTDMLALVESHPTLTWIRPRSAGAPHAATWDDDEGSQQAKRDDLRDLVLYLTAKLRKLP